MQDAQKRRAKFVRLPHARGDFVELWNSGPRVQADDSVLARKAARLLLWNTRRTEHLAVLLDQSDQIVKARIVFLDAIGVSHG